MSVNERERLGVKLEEGIAHRVDGKVRSGEELHRNMSKECEAAEWRAEIMDCEASSPPPSQATAGFV